MTPQPLRAGRGGFARARGQPHLRPMHGPVLAEANGDAVLGDPTSVPERPIGYGTPDGDGEPEPLRITSIQICPLVAIEATDDGGNVVELTATLETFVAFAQQVLAMQAAMPQAPQPAPLYEEPPQREAV